MTSLREECKERLKVAFDSIRATSGSLTFILVVDQIALKVLSSTIKMMELVNYGINSIERLQLKRKKFSKIEAVYLIHPDSWAKMARDFEDEEPQYHTIHILTLTRISEEIMEGIRKYPELVKRTKTLKQINFDFCLHNSNEAIIEEKGISFAKEILSGKGYQFERYVTQTVEQLETVVTIFSQFYLVDIFYSPPGFTNLAEKIAFGVKQRLQRQFEQFSKSQVPNYTSAAPQTMLLILDRSFDGITPLIRDFHYMPLLYDLKDCQKHQIKSQKSKDNKYFTMDEADPIFTKYKGAHISKTLSGMASDFDTFSQSHIGAKMQKDFEGAMELDKMKEVMKKIPQYTDMKEKYSFHMNATEAIMKAYEINRYKVLGQLQQNLACQVSQTGKAFKPGDLFNQVMVKLSDITRQEDRVRVILIALYSLELKSKEKGSLIDLLHKCPNYNQIHKNMAQLVGPSLYRLPLKKNKEEGIILDRFQTKIQEIVRKISEGGQADLKFLRVGIQSRSSKSPLKSTGIVGRKKIGGGTDRTSNKARLIVCITGAISYSEIVSLLQYQTQYEIIFVSHSYVTQGQFLQLINSIAQEEL